MTLKDMHVQKYAPSHPKQKVLNQRLIKMIVKDMQPVSNVEDIGFQALMKAADPLYTIPIRRTVMRELLPGLYASTAEAVKKNLQSASEITLTTDLWTSRANNGYIGVTAHFVQEGKMMSHTLTTQHFKDDHTGANIANVLIEIANDWGISDQVKLLFTDSASNMLLAMRLTPSTWEHLPCMAHVLNLVVRDAQKGDETLGSMITKIKDIVGYFHHSLKAWSKLEAHQKTLEIPQHCLIQECETRWNSTLEMTERAVEQAPAINTALGQVGRGAMAITDQELLIMRGAIVNLKDFEVVTSVLSGEKFATISSLIPLERGLKMMTKKTGGREELKAHLMNGLTKRFGKLEEMKRVALATLLDPRYKEAAFQNAEMAAKHKRTLYSEVAEILKEKEGSSSQASTVRQTEVETPEEDKAISKLLGFLNTNKPRSSGQEPNYQAMAIVETDVYLKEERIETKDDPLKFWNDNKSRYPHPHKLAFSYICVPELQVCRPRGYFQQQES